MEQNKYNDILRQIVSEIKSTRVVVARRVNAEMMQLYWSIGKRLSVEGLEKGYGSSVVKRLATDLQQEFPGTTGFSARNLWNMKRFYEFYALADEKVQRSVALLPWRHNLLIISKTGIVLCADKEHVEVEIALRDVNKPIGVADYQLQFPEKEIKELISNELKNKKID